MSTGSTHLAATRFEPLRSLRADAVRRAIALEPIPTPTLVIDETVVDDNIANAVRLIGAPDRWRAHCKTVKSTWAMQKLLAHGVRRFKASTVAEVDSLLRAGATDVLYALPAVGPTQHTLVRLAEQNPSAQIAALLDSPASLDTWNPGPLGVFLDVNTGMDRTGVPAGDPNPALELVGRARERGFAFRGLHHYDGHLAGLTDDARTAAAHRGLDLLARFAASFDELTELVTGGSHTFLPALEHAFPDPLAGALTVSPGTVVYCDLRSLERFGDIGFRPAVGVLSRVISAPAAEHVTVDAGLTAIQVDAGSPHAAVSGAPEAVVGSPSQEHLAIRFPASRSPAVGSLLTLVPRHVDTTVAQFDWFISLASDGSDQAHPLTARHHRPGGPLGEPGQASRTR